MKKRILSALCVALLFFSIPFFTAVPAQAADSLVLDGSELTQDEESVGCTNTNDFQRRGLAGGLFER